ncbi:hypothetical protein ACSBR1_000844 [Camellia fascicularis]
MVGSPREFGFPIKDHVQLGKDLDLIDFDAASEVSGSKFYYLKNEAVLLEMALINWTISQVMRRGFTPLATPEIVRSSVVEKCGFQPQKSFGLLLNINEYSRSICKRGDVLKLYKFGKIGHIKITIWEVHLISKNCSATVGQRSSYEPCRPFPWGGEGRVPIGRKKPTAPFFTPVVSLKKQYLNRSDTSSRFTPAKIPVGGIHMDSILAEPSLPLKYVPFSHCFRTEAGAATRGLYRVHQFSKLEMFILCRPEESDSYHEELIGIEEDLFSSPGFHFKY